RRGDERVRRDGQARTGAVGREERPLHGARDHLHRARTRDRAIEERPLDGDGFLVRRYRRRTGADRVGGQGGLELGRALHERVAGMFAMVQSTAAAVAIEQYASRLAGRIATVSQFFLRMDSLLPFFVPPCVDLRSEGQRTLLSLMTSCRTTAAREPRACGNHFPAAEPSCF